MVARAQQIKQFSDYFIANGTIGVYNRADFIIRPGETPQNVYFIKSGLVKAYDITKYQEENMLVVRKPGEIFPLIWAITGQERSIIYEALTNTEVYWLSQAQFKDFIEDNASAESVLLDMVVEMYRIHSERILNLEYRSVRERLISFLLTMSQRFGETTSSGTLITVPLRHQDIASSINATRETTNRQLVALERKKLLNTKNSMITLYDAKRLRKYI